MRRRHAKTSPEAHIVPAQRYWAGAEEIILGIVLQSPGLFAPNVRMSHVTVFGSIKRYDHQLRQIRRREARKHDSCI